MDLIQDATLGFNSLDRDKKNNFPLENPGRKGTEEQYRSMVHCKRNLSQVSSLTGQPQLTIIISQKKYLLQTTLCAS